jgi:hypothetical protein
MGYENQEMEASMIKMKSGFQAISLVVISSLLLTACNLPAGLLARTMGSGTATATTAPVADLPVQAAAPAAAEGPAVLLFGVGIHVEPFGAVVSSLVPGNSPGKAKQDPDYKDPKDFQTAVDQLTEQLAIINAVGGRATVQLQSPFTTTAIRTGSTILSDIAAAGNELALHFHEDAHLGENPERLPVATWCAVMREEIGYIEQAGGVDTVRYWSGGNLYPSVFEAGACAGLDVNGDWKNPREQTTPVEFTGLNPWRPSGGTDGSDLSFFVQDDPAGGVVYLPEGLLYRIGDTTKHELIRTGGNEAYMDYLEQALLASIAAADPNKVNVFHITIHPGEMAGDPADPYAALGDFLVNVVEPLAAQGKLQWATFSEMADAYQAWEAGVR